MKQLSIVIGLLLLSFGPLKAQDFAKNEEVLKVKTSAVCKMCKKRIEKDMSLTKGVSKAELDLETKVLTLVYNEKQTNPKKLKEAVSKIGYDAGEVVADQKAHNRLPDCCQKTAEPHVD